MRAIRVRTRSRILIAAAVLNLCAATVAAQSAYEPAWRFIQNCGQWDTDVRFAATCGAATVRIQRDGAVFRLVSQQDDTGVRGVVLRLSVSGSPLALTAEGLDELPSLHHFFLGNDPDRWRAHVPAYGQVMQRGVAPGVALRWRGAGDVLHFDVVAEPGIDITKIAFQWEGVERVEPSGDGGVLLETSVGTVGQSAPVAWEEDGAGVRHPVRARQVVLGERRFGFEVERRDPAARLVVDPGLEWSTLIGGSHQDVVKSVALGPDGKLTIAGETRSVDFPVTPGAFDTTLDNLVGNVDAYVARFEASGATLEFCTYVGGASPEGLVDVVVAANNEVVLAGTAFGPTFPTTPGAFDTVQSSWEAFATRLSADGSDLVYSTLVGGSSAELCYSMSLGQDGVVTLCGSTTSADFPVMPTGFDAVNEGAPFLPEAFVFKLGPAGDVMLASTFLGGASSESANVVAAAADGSVFVGGRAGKTGIPYTSVLGESLFVARFDATLGRLERSTALGSGGDDRIHDMALDSMGAAYLTGYTLSGSFPTTPGAFDTVYSGSHEAWVLKLAPDGSALEYSTFLGGGGPDLATAIAVESGVVTVVGVTGSSTFPTTPGAFHETQGGSAFVTRLSPGGDAVWYSTFLGGSSLLEGSTGDERWGLALGPEGEAIVGGYTTATDFPTTPGAFDRSANGMRDGFVARLDMLPTGVAKFGTSTPGCDGPLAAGVTAMARAGLPFGLTCTRAPTSSLQGVLVLGARALRTPLVAKSASLWIDPVAAFLLLPATSDELGLSWLQGVIPNAPALVGGTFMVQYFWPNACGAPGQLAASNALAITVQP